MAKRNTKSSADANMLPVAKARPKSMCTYVIVRAGKAKIVIALYRKGEWLVSVGRRKCKKEDIRYGTFRVVKNVEYVSDKTVHAALKHAFRRCAREEASANG